MFLKLDKHMKLVFDLKKQNECNKEHVQSVQKLTLNKSKMMGLKGTFGLYNSDEWWKNIKNKKIKSKIISGVITDLYKAGQDNSNEINSFNFISENGESLSSSIYVNHREDIHLFSKGKIVEIFYIYDELKDGSFIDLVVEMAVSIK